VKVLVAARPYDLSDAPADAFVTRHVAFVHLLADHYDVEIVGLRPVGDASTFRPGLASRVHGEVVVPRTDSPSRAARAARGLRRSVHEPLADWERSLLALAGEFAPAAVVTVGPWLDVEYRALFRSYPSVHLQEEDLSRMPELAPQSAQGRSLRAFEDVGRRRAGMRPEAVVVISDAEVAGARHRFPSAQVRVLPYTLDESEWPLADGPSDGDTVVVVNNLANARNADGLAAVLDEMASRELGDQIAVRLVSGAGYAPSLDRFASEPWIALSGPVGDVRAEYRHAWLALVPSTRATGFKTTVLQAWSAGCPVVCFPASAATLGVGAGDAVAVGATPAEIVDQILRLRGDAVAVGELVRAGLELVASRFRPDRQGRALVALVEQVAAG
jgi:glycosyltransferase involved in cell wall biosynthesis